MRSIGIWVFLGAMLLFGAEPLVGRLLLRPTGGSVYVWLTCLMFFQGMVAVAYVYCAALATRVGRWHGLVLFAPLLVLPFTMPVVVAAESALTAVLVGLVVHVALPFGALATTAVMAQQWVRDAGTAPNANPYPLYGISNAGSLAGVLVYPFLVEPFVGLDTQRWAWMVLYGLYALLGLCLLWRHGPRPTGAARGQRPGAALRSTSGISTWLTLTAGATVVLFGATNALSRTLGTVPYVWVLPLVAYLLSFVLTFRERSLVPRMLCRHWPELGALALTLTLIESNPIAACVVHVVAVFAVCAAAHRVVYLTRPPVAQLATYYVWVALGGWLGGAFAALVAPSIFDHYAEYPLGVLVVVLAVGLGRRERLATWLRAESKVLLVASAVFMLILGGRAATALSEAPATVLAERDLYGTYEVQETGTLRALLHNGVAHGAQDTQPGRRRLPQAYYAIDSPLGDVMANPAWRRHIEAVGLGVGSVAAYLQPGEHVVFYEIDPLVLDIAQRAFTFLADCRGSWEVVVGDARLNMERRAIPATGASVVFVDAFSGGAVPTHLLTVEALALYHKRLAADGVLLLHVSSHVYELVGMLAGAAQVLELPMVFKHSPSVSSVGSLNSTYVALAQDWTVLEPLRARGWVTLPAAFHAQPWTDDLASPLPLIRFQALWQELTR